MQSRYFKDEYFAALDIVKAAAEKAGLTMAECALRWVSHHSMMKRCALSPSLEAS